MTILILGTEKREACQLPGSDLTLDRTILA